MESVKCGTICTRNLNGMVYFLIVKQWNEMWSVPKGTLEYGETPAECARRETFEETGVLFDLDLFNIKYNYHNQRFSRKFNMFQYHYFLIDCNDIEIVFKIDNTEITDIMWASINEIEKLNINSILKHICKNIAI